MSGKNKKSGFIQVSIFIAILVGLLIIGGGGYVGVRQYQNYQAKKIEEKKQAQEKERLAQKLVQEKEQEARIAAKTQQKTLEEAQAAAETQQKALEVAQQEIEKLKEQGAESKKNQQVLEQKVQSEQKKTIPQNFSISATELSTYLSGVIEISCDDVEGSGSLWNLPDLGHIVLTNYHIIEGIKKDVCKLDIRKSDGDQVYGWYESPIISKYSWNSITDIVALKLRIDQILNDNIVKITSSKNESVPIDRLNYKISTLSMCQTNISIGSPVAVIGYPAFGKQKEIFEGNIINSSSRIVTDGIISGYEHSVYSYKLPYSNYYISAKIDSGNSGGIALSKDSSGLCVLGVPTWLTIGNYETQGIVQNIHNIIYQQ